jgi:hypothetical protein
VEDEAVKRSKEKLTVMLKSMQRKRAACRGWHKLLALFSKAFKIMQEEMEATLLWWSLHDWNQKEQLI